MSKVTFDYNMSQIYKRSCDISKTDFKMDLLLFVAYISHANVLRSIR